MRFSGPKLFAAVCGILFALVTFCPYATSQQAPAATIHTHYRIVFPPGTFGGPNNYFQIAGAHILNNEGAFVGWSDTPLPDPYPYNCWTDCIVDHAFEFRNGQMTDLGVLAPGVSSDTNSISPSGLITGEAQTGQEDPVLGWTMHGILWKHGQMIDLGTLDGGAISLTTAVNDSAEVVGYALNTIPDPISMLFGNQTRAYRWKNGVMTDLGTLGGPDAMALRINERGQISGNSYLSVAPSDSCGIETGAFIWEKGAMRDLGGLGGTCTLVNDMNNRGQIVGGSFLAGDQVLHPFLWQSGKLTDLGTQGGTQSAAQAVNDAGDVVGWQTMPGNDQISHGVLWTDGQIFDLGALGPGHCSFVASVNSQQQAVGVNTSSCDFVDHPNLQAVISERGGPLVDLNTLIPANSGVRLLNASTINERGEIVAYAFFPDGTRTTVLLVPCENDGAEACENSGTLPAETPILKAGAKSSTKPALWIHNNGSKNKWLLGTAPWIAKKP
jgi:probable HAF family extracellular repeat protein